MDWDFSQNREVEKLDPVPEDLRAFYGEKDDKSGFAVKDTPETKAAIGLIGRLNGALKSSRSEAKEATKKIVDLSPLAEFGEGIEEIKAGIQTKIEELNARVKGGKAEAANVDKLKKDLQAGHQKVVDAKQKEIDGLIDQLKELTVDAKANESIAKHKGKTKLLLPFVKKQVKTVVGEDGKVRSFVVDESGEPRYSQVSGQQMTIDELVNTMKGEDDYKVLFESEAKRGSGQAPNSSSGHRSTQGGRELSSVEKIAKGLADRERRR